MYKGKTNEKSLNFAIQTVNLCKQLNSKNEYVISRQIMRSGTAIGALIREAEYAESGLDFIHKLSIARKECNETMYWLELLLKTELIDFSMFESLNNNAIELMNLLTASIITKKANLKK